MGHSRTLGRDPGSSGSWSAVERAASARSPRAAARTGPAGLISPCGSRTYFSRRALVEVLVALGRVVERDHGGVDGLGDLAAVVEDRLHQLAVVAHHRALAGGERVRLRPAEPDADRQAALLGGLVARARVAGHVEAGDAERAAGAGDVHDELSTVAGASSPACRRGRGPRSRRRRPPQSTSGSPRICSIWSPRVALGQVDGLAAEAPRLREPLGVQVADDHHRRAEQLRRVRGREADRAGAGDVDRRSGRHARRHAAVVAGREDVREHRQVEDLLQRLLLVAGT